MRPPLSNLPLLPVAIGLIIGIWATRLGLSAIWATIPATAGVALIFFRPAAWAGILTVSAAIGLIGGSVSLPEPLSPSVEGHELYFRGIVTDISERETSTQFVTEIERMGTSGNNMTECKPFRCAVTSPSLHEAISPGSTVVFQGTLHSPVNDTYPDAFDYSSFLLHRGINSTAFVAPDKITHPSDLPRPPLYRIRAISHRLEEWIYSSSLSEGAARFLCATLLGDATAIEHEQRLAYSTAGISHILALSGLHVAIITTMLGLLLSPLYIMRRRRAAYIATIAVLWLYAIMTGLSPSVTRAVIMATLYFLSLILQRRHSPGNALAFAAICILIADPLSLFSIGFQLSFTAVATILLFADRLSLSRKRGAVIRFLIAIPAVSVAAMAGTAIVAGYYFHYFPVYFLLGNILTSLLLPPMIGCGIIIIFAGALGLPSGLLCSLDNLLFDLLDSCVHWVNALPGATISSIYFDGWVMLPYFAGILYLILASVMRRKSFPILTGCILLSFTFVAAAVTKKSYPNHELIILKDHLFTNIVYRHSTCSRLITTAPPQDTAWQLDRCNRRLRDYLGRRGCDSISEYRSIPANDIVVRFPGKTFYIVQAPTATSSFPDKINYLLITRKFKGEIGTIHETLNPDTILLGDDVHPSRHARYAGYCRDNHIPFRSLKEEGSFYLNSAAL